jgi:hypothetical protein
MSQEENVVEKGYKAFAGNTAQDWNTITGLLADDVILYDYDNPGAAPVGGPGKKADVVARLQQLRNAVQTPPPYTYRPPRSSRSNASLVVGSDHLNLLPKGLHTCIDHFKVEGNLIKEIHFCIAEVPG